MLEQLLFPAQNIAKFYTEGLGRLPDRAAIVASANQLNSCTPTKLLNIGIAIANSPEFNNRPDLQPSDRVLMLYRMFLHRDPDQSGHDYWVTQLSQDSTQSVTTKIAFSAESIEIAKQACTTNRVGGIKANPYLVRSVILSQADVQNQLNISSTVVLPARSTVLVTTTLEVPTGKLLTTIGQPPNSQYYRMARVIDVGATDESVLVNTEAIVSNIWIDGNGESMPYGDNYMTKLHNGGTFSNSRFSSPSGRTTLWTAWHYDPNLSATGKIHDNLFMLYNTTHEKGKHADGISNAGDNIVIISNQIVDASDVGIIHFKGQSAPPQQSKVSGNTILQAGNSAYAALAMDTIGQKIPADFTGATLTYNTILTAGATHYDIGISIGTRAWFAPSLITGFGGIVGNNTGRANVGIGIGASGVKADSLGDAIEWVLLFRPKRKPNRCYGKAAIHDSRYAIPTPFSIHGNLDNCIQFGI